MKGKGEFERGRRKEEKDSEQCLPCLGPTMFKPCQRAASQLWSAMPMAVGGVELLQTGELQTPEESTAAKKPIGNKRRAQPTK